MSHYVFVNFEKERLAREAMATKGIPKGRKDDDPAMVAECALYHRAKSENPGITDDELLLYIYRGLAGRVEEFSTAAEAEARVIHLKNVYLSATKKAAA